MNSISKKSAEERAKEKNTTMSTIFGVETSEDHVERITTKLQNIRVLTKDDDNNNLLFTVIKLEDGTMLNGLCTKRSILVIYNTII